MEELAVDEMDDFKVPVMVVLLTDELEVGEIVTVEISGIVVDLYQ